MPRSHHENWLFPRYSAVVALVLVWLASRYIAPAWFTLAGLVLIGAATVWLFVAIAKEPREAGRNLRTWWRFVWDGFCGL
jgi:hypothetical protein